ncbi:MAG: hypothetical protein PHF37_11095 [Phycisphaerae bacterium]|nr:hypothetical protein [Phycisphaerae bacterium]
MKKQIPLLALTVLLAAVLFAVGYYNICFIEAINAETVFTKSTDSYYGRYSAVSRYTAVISPAAGDANDISSSVSSEPIFGELRQITLAADGNDYDFKVIIKNRDLITIYEKADCNTALLPINSTLKMPDSNYPGILNTGPLIFETNDIDVNNLTSLTISIDYIEHRY